MIVLDKEKIEKEFREKLEVALKDIKVEIENEKIFWDMQTLSNKTSMSINTMKEHFFYDERFPKYQVGRKWYFPAKETQEFLLEWLKEWENI